MNNEFWLGRWKENRVGFHNADIQPLLKKFWPQVAADTQRVLVPLCGKSLDLGWLADRGHDVVGVELSQLAARAFGEEHALAFTVTEDPPLTRMRAGTIEFLIGDFFDLTPEQVGRFGLVYDRAALIALPAETRAVYASKLKEFLYIRSDILLISIEWDLDPGIGPPWAVDEAEVRELFADMNVERLEQRDCLDAEPRFRDRGATWMREVVYQISHQGDAAESP